MKANVHSRVAIAALAVIATALMSGCSSGTPDLAATDADGIPEVQVRFANEPYFDHSQSIIGTEKGYVKDVGITLDPSPSGATVNSSDLVSIFASESYDVVSASAQLLLPAAKTLPPFKIFSIADIFQGYAVMAQPDAGYSSVEEFEAQGQDPSEAIASAIKQLEGKRFVYPADAVIKGFIDQALSAADLTVGDVQSMVTDESQTVQAMEAGNADFQVGGVPSHLSLESAGFKSILTSGDLAKMAKPSADSAELTAVFHDGWVATDKWLDANHDTALRLASVSLRINQMINDSPDEALAIHTPFLNSIAGTDFDVETGKAAYETLNPFLTFEDLDSTFNDSSNPLNEQYVLGAAIKQVEADGVFDEGEYAVSNFTVAGKIYGELQKLKGQAESDIATVEAAIAAGEVDDEAGAQSAIDKAKQYNGYFDFLDGARFATEAITYVTSK